jgi:hypothetical protein
MAGGRPAFTTNIGYAFLLERLPGSALVECLIWHIADMGTALENVCFWGQSGHSPTAAYQTRFMSTRPGKPPLGPFALPEARVLQILLQGFALARHTLLYLKRDITDSLELTCGCLCDPDVPSPEGKHLSVGQRLELSK